MKLLSTKIISNKFKDLLIKNNYQIDQKSFIKILPFKSLTNISVSKNIIFTSKNAVNIILNNSKIKKNLIDKNFFCVGESTTELIINNNLNLIKSEQNSKKLSEYIVANFKNSKDSFTYFSGKKRLLELEKTLNENNIKIIVHEVYDTILNPKKIKDHYDGIIFYSPSAVKSFFKGNNSFKNTYGFCIGNTTAKELKKFSESFSISKSNSEENMLVSINKYFK
jgi:uroporphyrinogen-III synthase